MPLLETPPPKAAIVAFEEGLSWLRDTESRFDDLHLAKEIEGQTPPPPHAVETLGLDGRRLSALGAHKHWRFFVSGSEIPLGCIDVGETDASENEYEFLAFREGRPIIEAAKAFRTTRDFARKAPSLILNLLNVPSLGAAFFWLRTEDNPKLDACAWVPDDWLIPIPPAGRGFKELQPLTMKKGLDVLLAEMRRLRESNFILRLESEKDASARAEPELLGDEPTRRGF